jgi:hypothetical protein
VLDPKALVLAITSDSLKHWTLDNIKFTGTNQEW